MLQFDRWKMIAVALVALIGILFTLPNFVSRETLSALPDWLPKQQIALGLDLQGGLHLMVQVDRDDIRNERVEDIIDRVRQIRRTGKFRWKQQRLPGKGITLTLREGDDTAAIVRALREAETSVQTSSLVGNEIAEVVVTQTAPNTVSVTLNDEGLEQRVRNVVTQAIEVIRRRIDQSGTTEPSIQRYGDDRIIVQWPGCENTTDCKERIVKGGKLTFHLFDNTMSAEEAQSRGVPSDAMLLPIEGSGGQMGLIKRFSPVGGAQLVDARAGIDQRSGEPIVTFRFNSTGARIFGQVTTQNVNRPFAIVLDDKIVSAPNIQEPILGGSGQIEGRFTLEETQNLAIILRAGALPADLEFIEERNVGPSLGADSIRAGKLAGIFGGIAVIVFMIAAYGLFGIFATVALSANMFLIFGIMSYLGATLTLPGIAGIVLTMGMAVDANVLIYERIREEAHAGRSVLNALDSGFSRALSTILDANITTLIAALILIWLGTGPIRGFAVTLSIGIVTTVFTAFTFTRLLIVLWVQTRRPKAVPI